MRSVMVMDCCFWTEHICIVVAGKNIVMGWVMYRDSLGMEVIGVVALRSALGYGLLAFTYQTMQNAVGLFECSYMVSYDSEWGYKAFGFIHSVKWNTF